jgi:ribosomal protein S27AE
MLLGALGLLFGFGAGGALLMLSLVRMKETMRTSAPPAAPAAMVAQATPLCPTCGTPARFVHGEQRWHCDNCAQYL